MQVHGILLVFLAVVHQVIQYCGRCVYQVQVLGPVVSETVQSAGSNQVFDCFLIDRFIVDSFEEIVYIFIRSVFLPFFDDFFYGSFTHSLDGGHSETDLAM